MKYRHYFNFLLKTITFVLATLLFCLTTACSTLKGPEGILRDTNAELQSAYSLPPLKTPPGIVAIPSDPYYVVPATETGTQKVTSVSLLPPGSLAAEKNK